MIAKLLDRMLAALTTLGNGLWYPIIGENMFWEMPIEDSGLEGEESTTEGEGL